MTRTLVPTVSGRGLYCLTRRLGPALAPALLAAALGCGEDPVSPTDLGPRPTLASGAVAALAFSQVSAGYHHTCGLTTDNVAYCWGENSYGALGDGTTTTRRAPVAVAGGLRFRQVSAGYWFSCGVTTEYRAYCWGVNDTGHLGDGTTMDRSTPRAVAGGLRFAQVDAGYHVTCGVTTTDRRAYCWGTNWTGQLGDGTTTDRLTPVPVASGLSFRQVSVGFYHTCGVTTDDRAYCWGNNQYGQIGDSTEVARRLKPSRVAGTRRWRQVDAGALFNCGVTTIDRAFCWGNGRDGEIGNGRTYLSFWPRAVAGGLSFERVTAGSGHACGETTGNRAYCWGLNFYGELGDGTTTDRLTPVAVAGGLYFSQVSAGSYHTCGKTAAAVAYCWGNNYEGQLGDGTYTLTRLRPTRVAGAM